MSDNTTLIFCDSIACAGADKADVCRQLDARLHSRLKDTTGFSIVHEPCVDRHGQPQAFGDAVLYASAQEHADRYSAAVARQGNPE